MTLAGETDPYARARAEIEAASLFDRSLVVMNVLATVVACYGLLLARGEFELAEGALLLAFVNIVAIQSGASFVMWASGIARGKLGKLLAPDIISVGVLLLLAGFLVANLRTFVGAALFEATVSRDIKLGLADYPGTFLADLRFSRYAGTNVTIVQAVVRGPRELSADETGRLEDRLPRPSDASRLELRLRQIHTSVMTRSGPLFSSGKGENGDR